MAKLAKSSKINGFVIYRGPSMIDGQPIVAIATGLANGSNNEKTGDMVQTWIMREDIKPTEALNTGDDSSVCGDCKYRGKVVDGKNMVLANSLGFRTFRVTGQDSRTVKTANEVICPASKEMDYKTNCAACKACGGNASKAKANILITVHGAANKKHAHDAIMVAA